MRAIRTYNPYDRTPGNDTARIPLEASPASPYRAGRAARGADPGGAGRRGGRSGS
ncbi:hypothetical protein N4G69_31595 [Streptomyces mirabilis]|uniref:hypothetical protein n=1 Tax=Streptomyces mirabilis TaxID=68239 RepID=UPI0021BF1497|nr:hypothetical protein [Streptomyces mirabilis]MCT9110081.1 hypothetical protein [Streptomyces mirabilis]